MANKRFLLILILITTLVVVPISAQDDEPVELRHLVLGVNGSPMILRASGDGGYATPQPISAGAFVGPQDVFNIPSGDSDVTILCADENVVVVDTDFSVAPCSDAVSPNNVINYGDVTIYRSSRRSSSTTSFVLFPRNTVLLEAPDEFKWESYAPNSSESGATITYQVEIILRTDSGSEVLYTTTTDQTRFSLSENDVTIDFSPNLANDENAVYQLVVRPLANGVQTGNDDPYLPQGFCILDPRLDTTVEANVEAIANLDASSLLPSASLDNARNYYLALYYYSEGLLASALDILEDMAYAPPGENLSEDQMEIGRIPGSPSFYILLGRVYNAMRLPQMAELAYNQALEIAVYQNDIYSQAFVLELLGDLARGGSPVIAPGQPAYQYYTDSIALYEEISASILAEAVQLRRDEPVQGAPDAGPCSRTR